MTSIQPILIVDDDSETREALRNALEEVGFIVVEAKDGRAALHYLTAVDTKPSLILLDLRMPNMTGWELMGHLKSYALSRIPVVVMSAFEPYEATFRIPTVGFLQKPIAVHRLMAAVTAATARA